MRRIEEKMVAAVNGRYDWHEGNTAVRVNDVTGDVFVTLHGNTICRIIKGKRYYDDCGWGTATTTSRLRALGADITFSQRDGIITIHNND